MGASQTATTQTIEEEKEFVETVDETAIETCDINDIKYDYKDYRSIVAINYIKYCILIHCKYLRKRRIPTQIIELVTNYVPVLYQIYKISKTKIKSPSRAPSPSPSLSSVSSINSYASFASHASFDGNHNHQYTKIYVNQIERMYEWETMTCKPSNLYHCGNKYFIKAANDEIYGMGTKVGNKSLGNNILLMSDGICAGSIAIKYKNGYIYTSKIRAKSFNKFAGLRSINIISIEAGYKHILFLSNDGKVYAQGNNDLGQCGIGDLQINEGQIAIIEHFVQQNCFISSISCGFQHSVCIDAIKNKMYTFGDNTFYQCSSNMHLKCIKLPTQYKYLDKIDETTNVVKAECGKNFTCCLTDQGYFYGWGRAKFITKSKNHRDDLMKNGVWFNTNKGLYKDMSAGFDHIVLITKFGERIITFGYKFDRFNSDLRVIPITDSLVEIDRNSNFDQVEPNAKIARVIAGIENMVIVFKN